MDKIIFPIKHQDLNRFLTEVKSVVSKETYVQKDEFQDILIPLRGTDKSSGMIGVEIKGESKEINKIIKILNKYE